MFTKEEVLVILSDEHRYHTERKLGRTATSVELVEHWEEVRDGIVKANIVYNTAARLECSEYRVFLLAYSPREDAADAAYDLYTKENYITHRVRDFCEQQLNIQQHLF